MAASALSDMIVVKKKGVPGWWGKKKKKWKWHCPRDTGRRAGAKLVSLSSPGTKRRCWKSITTSALKVERLCFLGAWIVSV